ncbi:hypothetical protein UB46_28715 [Burkholderiaceae bacterium 16]|nr:hypothetical protein UB46_28715 [Burkholderiaceae bacterium 16]
MVALAGLIEAGMGVSCLPLHLFDQQIRQKRLQVVSTEPPAPKITYYAAFLKQHQAVLGYAVADIARQCCDFSSRKQPTRRRAATSNV